MNIQDMINNVMDGYNSIECTDFSEYFVNHSFFSDIINSLNQNTSIELKEKNLDFLSKIYPLSKKYIENNLPDFNLLNIYDNYLNVISQEIHNNNFYIDKKVEKQKNLLDTYLKKEQGLSQEVNDLRNQLARLQALQNGNFEQEKEKLEQENKRIQQSSDNLNKQIDYVQAQLENKSNNNKIPSLLNLIKEKYFQNA